MRQLLLGALVFLTAACGAYAFPGGSSPSSSTGIVSGKVVSVPCAPVERLGSPCPGRPVAGLEIDFVCGPSDELTKAVTDTNGNYSARVTAGTCSVKFKTSNMLRYISGPLKITVSAAESVVANYVFDNGIRVAVPQQ